VAGSYGFFRDLGKEQEERAGTWFLARGGRAVVCGAGFDRWNQQTSPWVLRIRAPGLIWTA
jgi:hypothetical protein